MDTQNIPGWKCSRPVIGLLCVTLLAASQSEADDTFHKNEYLRLQEEVCIGTGEGGEPDILGNPVGIAASQDQIFILDESVPRLRVYDFDGRHIKDIGRKGQGPGEYQEPWALGRSQNDGQLFIREAFPGRLHVYSATGDPLGTWQARLGGRLAGLILLLRVTFDGTPYLRWHQIYREPGSKRGYEYRDLMLGINSDGSIADTLKIPEFESRSYQLVAQIRSGGTRTGQVPFGPQVVWSMTYSGAIIAGYSAEYRIEIHDSDGAVREISREVSTVPIQREERRWYERMERASMEIEEPGWVWNGPPIPDVKPFFIALIPDQNGRIWILRQGPGRKLEGCNEDATHIRDYVRNPCWEDTYIFDVFDGKTGEFLGEVIPPVGFQYFPEPVINDDLFIACVIDETGAPLVKRFRLLPP